MGRPRILTKEEAYRHKKDYTKEWARQASIEARDIGLPPKRTRAQVGLISICKNDLCLFLRKFMPNTFTLPFSQDHLRIIKKIQDTILGGGLFALAMPRGSGKTSIIEGACLWALLYGHRKFIALIGAEQSHAEQMLASIKQELENSEELEIFYDVTFPIRALEGLANRARGQTYKGHRTQILWTTDQIVLPSVKDSCASEGVVRAVGLTSSKIRGMKRKNSLGENIRVDFAIIDDPQDEESAKSLFQTESRERIIKGAVLGLAGPGKKISGFCLCTVIQENDLSSRLLNRQSHPDWCGEKCKMVETFPVNISFWEQYKGIREDSLRSLGNISKATEFYKNNQEMMDSGAKVTWESRFNVDEISAVQNAMNLLYSNERSFWAEYQNDPMPAVEYDEEMLSADDIASKLNNRARFEIPQNCSSLTAMIDVHKDLLYYCVVAWESNFNGYVLDYGTYPRQAAAYFALNNANPSISSLYPGKSMEAALYAAIDALCQELLAKEWKQEGEQQRQISRCLIDANWAQSTELVYQYCRQSPYSSILIPSHGKAIRAGNLPMGDWHKHPGDKVGLNWTIPARIKRSMKRIIYDTNFWKSFLQARLAASFGELGNLSLWGNTPKTHQLFSEHLVSEYKVKTEARGRIVEEWELKATRPDNHWLDCLTGCCVAASVEGSVLAAQENRKIKREKVKLSEIAKTNIQKVQGHNRIRLSDIQKMKK
jgi:hypothetical protein